MDTYKNFELQYLIYSENMIPEKGSILFGDLFI